MVSENSFSEEHERVVVLGSRERDDENIHLRLHIIQAPLAKKEGGLWEGGWWA